MRVALSEAEKCTPTPTAFCVGCVLVVDSDGSVNNPVPTPATVLSTGYSRELNGNTHAEANALQKLRSAPVATVIDKLPRHLRVLLSSEVNITAEDILPHVDVYTTMEPCSTRTSGLAPCSDALITAKVRRCFIGVGEPADFVNCEGARKLTEAGIEVVWLKGLEDECLRVARKGR
ncbi:cytidine deaminase-like protein [Fistulina hepatica ATCC 64428]|nr:cytidine deaminase-like protein [Fistulina hepatica ATCC 64428]